MAIAGPRRKNKHAPKRYKHVIRKNRRPIIRRKHIKKYNSLTISNRFIVKSKQSVVIRIRNLVITLILWFYMLIVLYFFISACFNYNDSFIRILKGYFKMTNADIRYFIIISVIYFCLSFIILFAWKMYNKKRFGSLNRRRKPEPTSDEEMLSLKLIKPEVYKILKRQKIIIFDKNPVRELSRRK